MVDLQPPHAQKIVTTIEANLTLEIIINLCVH